MRTANFPIAITIVAVLASILPAYFFLLRPPSHAAIGDWVVAEHGNLTAFGACTGAIITIGFAAYGAGVAQICRWAFNRFVMGGTFDAYFTVREQLSDRYKSWPIQPTDPWPSERDSAVRR